MPFLHNERRRRIGFTVTSGIQDRYIHIYNAFGFLPYKFISRLVVFALSRLYLLYAVFFLIHRLVTPFVVYYFRDQKKGPMLRVVNNKPEKKNKKMTMKKNNNDSNKSPTFFVPSTSFLFLY